MNKSRSSKRQKLHPRFATRQFDWLTLILVLFLCLLGLFMIFNSSNVEAYYRYGDKFYFTKLQLIWFGVGLAGLFLASFFPLKIIYKLSPYFFYSTLILLIVVLIPGVGTKIQGARRWLYFGQFSLQPSELVKLASILYFPAFLTRHTRLPPFLFLVTLILGLLILEPDMGTALIVVAVAFIMYFLAGAPLKNIFLVITGLVVTLSLLVFSSDYRKARLTTFLNPNTDPLGASYHIKQVLFSLGSGGFTGSGIGRSRQKYQYLPEASTDSIFAVTAEEMGFLGSTLVLALFGFLYIRGFKRCYVIEDKYARLLATAAISWLSVQTIINLAAIVVLIPLTGVPLPFISYGGSSLVMALTAVGLYINANRH